MTKLTKVVKIMSDGLRNSNKMFLELEEKTLKFEEQQKREEREFQLKMVQMLQGGMDEAVCTLHSITRHHIRLHHQVGTTALLAVCLLVTMNFEM